jgi:hypothetical protein
MSKFILDTRLGEAHYIVCTEAIRRNIIEPEDLNEGRRTKAEQLAFVAQKGIWSPSNPTGAAPYSKNAPHIWFGRPNHAIDANVPAVNRLAAFYRSLGIPVAFNVPGEPWHMAVLSATALLRAAAKIKLERRRRDKRELHRGERSNEVKWLKHQLHYINDPDTLHPYFARGRSKPQGGWGNVFDEDLEGAVKRFQRDRGMRPDGVVGPKTERAIDRAYNRARKRRKG